MSNLGIGQTAITGSGSGSSGPTLETNGTPNSSQAVLNLVNGTNVTVTDTGSGNISIDLPIMTNTVAGAVPTPPNDATKFLNGTGVFSVPAGGGAGSLTLLEQHTAAASAALNFTTCFSATYDEYLIEIVNLIAATNSVRLILQVSTNGGVSYDTANNYKWGGFFSVSNASALQGSDADSSISVCQSVSNTASDGGSIGSIRFFNPLSTTAWKMLQSLCTSLSTTNSGRPSNQTYSSVYMSTTAVNAFRILFTAGNIASGTVRVYGISK